MDLESTMAEIEQQWKALGEQLAKPSPTSDGRAFREQARRHAELGRMVDRWRELKKQRERLTQAESLVNDSDPAIASLAREEVEKLRPSVERLTRQLRLMLLPRDPRDERNVILEVRAGTGGEEAALFARDLLRMYSRYAERKGWRFELLSLSESEVGGVKEAVASVQGDRVYSVLKYESGTHRVQRVPVTEASGRIHTSAATVAILPEADEIDIKINPEDLRITVQRSSGPGGQHVNKTDSSVRIMHIPTGITVVCQDEKSQHKNKAKALKILRARLLEREEQRRQAEISADRKRQVGSGDRSQRIRTYNFPQNRVTDHRIGLTLYKLGEILDGDLDEITEALMAEQQSRQLAAME